jgi:hypothetical protein
MVRTHPDLCYVSSHQDCTSLCAKLCHCRKLLNIVFIQDTNEPAGVVGTSLNFYDKSLPQAKEEVHTVKVWLRSRYS